MRPYRIISGVACTELFNGENQPTKVQASISDDTRDHYFDESIKLSEENIKSFKGKPICVEHDEDNQIGEITEAWKDSDGHMRITARIFTDSQKDWYGEIQRGNMKDLSVGYEVFADASNTVTRKKCNEVSICQKGFFRGAAISVCATGKEKYKGISSVLRNEKLNCFVFSIMASETNSSASPIESSKDASELARVHDELLRRAEEQSREIAELKKLKEENDTLKNNEKNRLAQYAESRKPQLKEVLELTEQQFKEMNPDMPFPADFKQSAEAAFSHPDGERNAAVITASAMSYKKQRDAETLRAKEMEEMKKKLHQMESDHQVAMTHVKASERMHMITETPGAGETKIAEVSASRANMSNLFNPADWEKQLMRENYGVTDPAKIVVRASATQEAPPQQHQFSKFVPNSLSQQPGGRVIYDFLRMNADKFSTTQTRGIIKNTTEIVEK